MRPHTINSRLDAVRESLVTAANDFLVGQGAGQVVKKTLVETKAILGVTGLGTYAVGDLLYASTVNALSVLPDVAVGSALISGGVGVAPAWGKIGLTTHVSGILGSANGGTGNGFTKFSGPTTAEKTFTLPDASATILTSNAAVTAAQGGTGQSSYAVGDLLYASAANALSKLADVAVGRVLVSGGVGVAPAWSSTPTLAGITCTAINPLTTPAESWIGPSSTTGIYFKSGNVGIGTTNPSLGKLQIDDASSGGNVVLALNVPDDNRRIEFVTPTPGGWPAQIRTAGTGNGLLIKSNAGGDQLFLKNDGNVGIGTAAPTNILSLGGNAARIFWMERHTTANTAGKSLTVQAGGATSGATDKAGGDLLLKPGRSTGTGESGLQLQGCVAGGAGTGDNSFATILQILGNKLALFGATPVAQQLKANHNDWAAVSDVVSALVNLGLFDQN